MLHQDKPSFEEILEGMRDLLEYKNAKYGNSAGEPVNIFSKQNPEEGIRQRLDDKLMRIKTSDELRKNDISDTIGYLVLLCRENRWSDFSEFKD